MKLVYEKIAVISKKWNKISKILTYIYAICMAYLMSSTSVLASANTEADNAWNTIMGFVLLWVPKLGVVVLFVGAIEFALAFKSDDPEGKTKGIRTAIAGAMVIAIPSALKNILLK